MRKAALGIGIILLLVLAAGAWLLADLNRFRPQVEALIAEQAGLDIEIGGDLGWRLLPAPAVTAALVRADDGRWQVDEWRYNPILDRHSMQGLQFKTQGAEGRCDLELTPRHNTSASPQADVAGIVPVQALRQVNGGGRCQGVGLHFANQDFEDLAAEFDVADGIASLNLRAPSVFGGTAAARLEVDASADPLEWTVRFNADRLQTQNLQPWLGEAVQWDAEIDYAGEWRTQGNSAPELASSIVGESRLTGGPGRIGAPFLDQVKKAASPFARGAGKAAPGPVQYQNLAGTWSIDGAAQRLSIALDNLVLKAEGEYQFAEDRLDITAKVAIEEGADDAAFEANPLLTGIPIPLRCAGTLAEPGCELDNDAVRQLLAEATKDGSEMQRKVDAIIEERLPPKQRQAARAVLRLLGGSIKEEQP
ncbi:MAG: AsmA family protein [Gammaproteobacteria bacterium]|nr:AsmA family protein [Gammaproteobacteria bacterium]MYK84037.1 AsmA family protein [Gammaproteobacteria bacterium]